jgi:cold shock CspA family protein
MTLKDAYYNPNPKPDLSKLPERIVGAILHTNKKGFGFIQSPAIPFERIYFYWTALNQDNPLKFLELKKGMLVEFTPKKYEKGWRAIKVKVM